MSSTVNVLIVDDSAFMRKSLSIMLESDPGIKIIGTARDGLDGYEKVKALRPDVITMDVEMPRMDGLTALEKIMKDCPTPVLMVSSITTEGAEATLKAMDLGAVDFIPKQLSYVSLDIVKIKHDLVEKVKAIARSRSLSRRLASIRGNAQRMQSTAAGAGVQSASPSRTQTVYSPSTIDFQIVTLGISTGGPFSLQKIIPMLPKNFPLPILIVQHMPPKFTKSLSDRLDGMSQIAVKEAEHGEPIRPGVVYIAQGGFHMKAVRTGISAPVISISEQPDTTLHRPSVDVMMESAVQAYNKNVLGVIMTGMGHDGLDGLKLIKSRNGYCLAQNEDTCVVYGMPKSAVDAGLADSIVPLEQIPETIVKLVMRK
ncbi:MAG TPA: chemotaxis response regulator protein-glutamate methylesterase [Bacteroidota bacterium]|nr:chemotaxis response regulator protein-glutamate methylesterase [Bacteroidota bacterium]